MANANTETTPAAAAAATSTPCLTCYFKTRNETGDGMGKDSTSGKAFLFQEAGKKSSYLLQEQDQGSPGNSDDNDDIDCYSIPKPAHLVIEHDTNPTTNPNNDCPFFFGGLQIVFSTKSIEIYLTSPGGKETYLMTCKGIPYKKNTNEDAATKSASSERPKSAEWFRALCVVPGGPRSVSRLRIKLIGSTSATDATIIKVQYMKITARIVQHPPSPTRATTMKSTTTNTNSQRVGQKPSSYNAMFAPLMSTASARSTSEPPLTQSDLGAAMAGLSFMARKTEENMAELFKQQSKKVEEHVESCFTRMELQMRALKPTLAVQHQLIIQNQTIMKEQQRIMEYQTTQINNLLNDKHDLKVRVQSLQADISIIRSQSSNNNEDKVDTHVDHNVVKNSDSSAMATGPPNIAPMVDANDSPTTPSSVFDPENLDCTATAQKKGDKSCQIPIPDEGSDTKMENILLRNAIQNTSKGIDEKPLVAGCGGPTMMYDDTVEDIRITIEDINFQNAEEEIEMKANNLHFKKALEKTAKEIEEGPFNGGCGSMLTGAEVEIIRKIDAVISSHANPTTISKDSTNSPKLIPNNNDDEVYDHIANIEVTLVDDERTVVDDEDDDEEVPPNEKSIIESSSEEMLDVKSQEDK